MKAESSLYGFNLLRVLQGWEMHRPSAFSLANFAVTHGGRYPINFAVDALGMRDRAAFEALKKKPDIVALPEITDEQKSAYLAMAINALGRLHIRPADEAMPHYDENDEWLSLGFVARAQVDADIDARLEEARLVEDAAYAEIHQACQELNDLGTLAETLEQVIDHVEHVESVCFFVGDKFFALIDRYVNLIDTKGGKGFLPQLRALPFAEWSREGVIIVAALHGLFTAGKSVKFEEFNGVDLSATSLVATLRRLAGNYIAAGETLELSEEPDIFELAQEIRRHSLTSMGQPWLRYRRTYGLTFRKTEHFVQPIANSEPDDVYVEEFSDDFARLMGTRPETAIPEHLFFSQLANACLVKDTAGIPCDLGSDATAGWIEFLIEKIVTSAVVATESDYGMSSSLRDMSKLVCYNQQALIDYMHTLTPAEFYTCFVSVGLLETYGKQIADVIASSVQKRMMFNRWHFFPGNFDRDVINASRHWYYPPLVPDIATHSNMHRAAHSRAQVKFAIRAPGPDMSRPALSIANQKYRGFYDVRVVRMDGDREYTEEDMVRARRRTLWLEAVYRVLVGYLQTVASPRFEIKGFQPGKYLDMNGEEIQSNVQSTESAAAAASME
jgi:hypothetical protein